MQNQKRTLEAVLSYDFSNVDSPSKMKLHSKLVLTRTNSADIKHTPKNTGDLFSRDRPSFRASKNRKPTESSFQNTLEPELKSDQSLLLASYTVSAYPTELDGRVEKRISKKRSKYQYRDFDATEYERKEKRFFGQMGYLCTFLVFICIVAVYLKAATGRTKLPVSNSQIIVGQSQLISPPVAQEPFNVNISSFLMANDSIMKETLAKKIAEMRRQILRSAYR